MKKEKWFYASYCETPDGDTPDGDYFVADTKKEAVRMAKSLAKDQQLDLLQVTRVDPDLDWEEVETIWY